MYRIDNIGNGFDVEEEFFEVIDYINNVKIKDYEEFIRVARLVDESFLIDMNIVDKAFNIINDDKNKVFLMKYMNEVLVDSDSLFIGAIHTVNLIEDYDLYNDVALILSGLVKYINKIPEKLNSYSIMKNDTIFKYVAEARTHRLAISLNGYDNIEEFYSKTLKLTPGIERVFSKYEIIEMFLKIHLPIDVNMNNLSSSNFKMYKNSDDNLGRLIREAWVYLDNHNEEIRESTVTKEKKNPLVGYKKPIRGPKVDTAIFPKGGIKKSYGDPELDALIYGEGTDDFSDTTLADSDTHVPTPGKRG